MFAQRLLKNSVPPEPLRGTHALSQQGMALLVFTIVLTLLLSIGAFGYLVSERALTRSVPEMVENNRAQAAAVAGVDAVAQYYTQALCQGANACVPPGTPPAAALVNATAQGHVPMPGTTQATVTAETLSNGIGSGGNLVLDSTGSYGSSMATAQAILTLTPASGTLPVLPYSIYVKGNAVFNGNANLAGSAIGVSGNATVNGNIHMGSLSANSINANGGTRINTVDATNSIQGNGGQYGQIQVGKGGSYSGSFGGTTPTYLTQTQTNQLNADLNDDAPNIDPSGLEPYAGIRLLNLTSGSVQGPVVVIEPWMRAIYPNIPVGTFAENSAQWDTFAQIATGSSSGGFSYQSGSAPGDGTWIFNDQTTLNAFVYAEGDIVFNGNTESADNTALFLTLASTGSVVFNGNNLTSPFATSPGLCAADAADPVCLNGQASPQYLGLSTVSGLGVNGSGSGITYNGNSTVGGSIASLGTIIVNGNSQIDGDVMAENTNNNATALELTFNGNAGTPVKDANKANYGGGSTEHERFSMTGFRWLS